MRAREFINENASSGATSSGSIATVSQPMGSVISRSHFINPTKYANSVKKEKKQNANR
jgi:hypothetical protein